MDNAHIECIAPAHAIDRLCLVLGDQLDDQSALWAHFNGNTDAVWMAEVLDESLDIVSSKQRTVLFLSAMRHFAQQQSAQQRPLIYVSLNQKVASFAEALHATLHAHNVQRVCCVVPGDYRLVASFKSVCAAHNVALEWVVDTHFVSLPGEFEQWMTGRKQPRLEYWYRQLRKRTGILMQANGQPEGERWNFDADNRQAFAKAGPQNLTPPLRFSADALTLAVMHDVQTYLPNLPGYLNSFDWPVTRVQALNVLAHFIEHRLRYFGDHQDAMWTSEPWLFHSHISAMLNLKLLNPHEVLQSVQHAYVQQQASLNAVEGFIRQVLGWREYVRGLYWHYRHDWLEFNALDAHRALPSLYWHGQTKMVCLHHSIEQVLTHGYGHHIQRLMVTGLFALLWGAKPQQVHEWYLAMFVDAVAWVEVPNTLGMSQFADGGIVGSKPYIASGAYINRMSNYCKQCPYKPTLASGEQACPFTTLYWDFVRRHESLLAGHPRLGMQVKNWQQKTPSQQHDIGERAQWLFEHIESV
ncbi:cryptochrome/photolyase family protein [Thiomicrorhabdus aquaedulcis]|uniref:cryptochrome/photolyase family protein n=1 Tax=Thiomicrorhabdus aquaedulcis TaxID=2211106 RepID=UPI000FD6F441|nr:cryptochrome/photolyase family protein [Thiomicrorhabdus aquaedulcis]